MPNAPCCHEFRLSARTRVDQRSRGRRCRLVTHLARAGSASAKIPGPRPVRTRRSASRLSHRPHATVGRFSPRAAGDSPCRASG
jgi:hypothetical protein